MSSTRRSSRRAGPLVPLTLALLCAGCTISTGSDDQPLPAPTSTAPRGARVSAGGTGEAPSASVRPAVRPTDVTSPFEAPTSAVTWWHEHPELAPADVDEATVVVDQAMTGPGAVALPDLSSYRSVLLVVTCSTESHYVLQLGTAGDPAWTWTMGESCGGPALGSFTSPPLDHADPVTTMYVQVPRGTKSVVTVLGLPAEVRVP